MKTVVLVGWFLITTYGRDETHNYLLEDRKDNIFVALSADEELPYPVGTWGKFKIEAECETVEMIRSAASIHMFSVQGELCNASKFEILPCKRPFIVGGIAYCE